MKHDNTISPLAERLREIPLTESEREAALLHLARGERFADLVVVATDAVRRLMAAASRSTAISARRVRVAFRRAWRGKTAVRRHGTPRAHPH